MRECGSCIRTMHQLIPCNWFKLSWPNTTFLWFERLYTLPTWLLEIFGCSPTWKCSWKDSNWVMRHYTMTPNCTPFTKRNSRNALKNGGTAGRSVFSHKETTSKGIRIANLQVCKSVFSRQRSDTFWSGNMFLYNYSYVDFITVIRYPDDCHGSDWNMLVRNTNVTEHTYKYTFVGFIIYIWNIQACSTRR
jgi:hypothetical protein